MGAVGVQATAAGWRRDKVARVNPVEHEGERSDRRSKNGQRKKQDQRREDQSSSSNRLFVDSERFRDWWARQAPATGRGGAAQRTESGNGRLMSPWLRKTWSRHPPTCTAVRYRWPNTSPVPAHRKEESDSFPGPLPSIILPLWRGVIAVVSHMGLT